MLDSDEGLPALPTEWKTRFAALHAHGFDDEESAYRCLHRVLAQNRMASFEGCSPSGELPDGARPKQK